ncbi:MAG TPA: hypothetical protein VEJ44_00420, partial [Acidimicrobiales bacterium]|nr:hypothetical protein [Acidimicrobiales bacterium]
NGEDYSTVPNQQFQRFTWMTVQRGPAFQRSFRVTFRRPARGATNSAVLVSLGSHADVAVSAQAARRPDLVRLTFGFYGDGRPQPGNAAYVRSGTTHQVVVVTDPAKRTVSAALDGAQYMISNVVVPQPMTSASSTVSPGSPPSVSVVNTTPLTPPALCRSLLGHRRQG